jgi:hypothetical protein
MKISTHVMTFRKALKFWDKFVRWEDPPTTERKSEASWQIIISFRIPNSIHVCFESLISIFHLQLPRRTYQCPKSGCYNSDTIVRFTRGETHSTRFRWSHFEILLLSTLSVELFFWCLRSETPEYMISHKFFQDGPCPSLVLVSPARSLIRDRFTPTFERFLIRSDDSRSNLTVLTTLFHSNHKSEVYQQISDTRHKCFIEFPVRVSLFFLFDLDTPESSDIATSNLTIFYWIGIERCLDSNLNWSFFHLAYLAITVMA